jgi:beta-xylosidase
VWCLTTDPAGKSGAPYWLTYSVPGWDGTAKTSGCGLLKSTSAKPEGPDQDMQPTERLGDEIDASLFQNDDGKVYYLWHSGKIARLKSDMSGLAETYHWLRITRSDPDPRPVRRYFWKRTRRERRG